MVRAVLEIDVIKRGQAAKQLQKDIDSVTFSMQRAEKQTMRFGTSMKKMLFGTSEGLERVRKEFDFTFLSFIFAGMAMQRFGISIIKSLFATYTMVRGEQAKLNTEVLKMRASFAFLKFSIISALEQSALFEKFVEVVVMTVDAISDLTNRFPKLSLAIVGVAAGFAAFGTFLLTLGLIQQGIIALGSLLGAGLFGSVLTQLDSIRKTALAGFTVPIFAAFGGFVVAKLLGLTGFDAFLAGALGLAAGAVKLTKGGATVPIFLTLGGFFLARKLGIDSVTSAIAAAMGLGAGTLSFVTGTGFVAPFFLTFGGVLALKKVVGAAEAGIDAAKLQESFFPEDSAFLTGVTTFFKDLFSTGQQDVDAFGNSIEVLSSEKIDGQLNPALMATDQNLKNATTDTMLLNENLNNLPNVERTVTIKVKVDKEDVGETGGEIAGALDSAVEEVVSGIQPTTLG